MDNDHNVLLQVTTIMIPVEVGWAVTVQWTAGDILCRIFAFFRIFGHYLSSFILVCISIDRLVRLYTGKHRSYNQYTVDTLVIINIQ